MKVTVVGCSGSFAGPTSPAACYLVQAEHAGRTWSIALDLGSGALGALQRHLDPRDLDAVVLSHLHPDHCIDLCGLFVIQKYHPDGPSDRLPVHAPVGTARRLTQAYGLEDGTGMDGYFQFEDLVDGQPFVVGPFTVTPLAVLHPVPAFGLRVEADGAALAYTGDTDRCDALGPLMTGADLVLADSAFVQGRDSATGIHMNGAQCAEAALAAGGVGRLMLTHIPAWNDPEVCRAQAAAHWLGEVELAEPGRTYDLSP
ncbi:MBL fold metallo-hydrolase [Lapillicoccus sp.]|uniref:MBL fold metallo-hydrolase n=1 Tax=Lapillicoccus sp. TaxID=1909287 RepID=UPI0027BD06E6|nr:MBL fold metallo-hydrolase [Actinomycetota bacterium]